MSDAPATHTHHAIDYVEIAVRNLAESKAFYAAVFGWEFNDYGPAYAGIKGIEREQGGLTEEPTARANGGGPLVILYSGDLDETLAAIRKASVRVISEPYAFPGGRRFHFADPSGNELAVWSER